MQQEVRSNKNSRKPRLNIRVAFSPDATGLVIIILATGSFFGLAAISEAQLDQAVDQIRTSSSASESLRAIMELAFMLSFALLECMLIWTLAMWVVEKLVQLLVDWGREYPITPTSTLSAWAQAVRTGSPTGQPSIALRDLMPTRLARLIYEGPLTSSEPTYALSWFRSVIGLMAVVSVSGHYRDWAGVLIEAYEKVVKAAAFSLVSLAVFIPLFYMLAALPGRESMRAGKRGMIICVITSLVVAGLAYPVANGQIDISASVPAFLLLAILLVWFTIFSATGVLFASRSVFRSGELHPLLGPCTSIVVSAYMFVSELVDIEDSLKGVPLDLWLALGLGGFASATAISVLEVRLARSEGARVRNYGGHSDSGGSNIVGAAGNGDGECSQRRRTATLRTLAVIVPLGCAGIAITYTFLGGGLAVAAAIALIIVFCANAILYGPGSVRDLLRGG